MTLAQSLDDLKRNSGDLFKGVDWNDLLGAVAQGDADLRAVLQSKVDELTARIDAVVEGTATVHADPGDDLVAALHSLPRGVGEIALSAGVYELAAPLVISNRRRVVISGAGPATILRAPEHETTLVLDSCQELLLSRLRVEGGKPAAGSAATKHINGALTVLGGSDVAISECTLACTDADTRTQSCLLAKSSTRSRGERLRVDRCRLEVGAWQTGALILDPLSVTVERSTVLVRPGVAAGTSAGQGIVVAGVDAGIVRILDNVLQDTVQGIHVGVSRRGLTPRPSADIVVLSGNVINALVPSDYRRDRFAIFVGNARSLSVLDTTATLLRSAIVTSPDVQGKPPRARVTPVEGVRLHGTFGPYLVVRGTSVRGFHVGVRVVPMQPPTVATWTVTDTLADGAAVGVEAPDTVAQQRNQPVVAAPRPGTPARLILTPAVGTNAAGTLAKFTATVFDVKGLRVPAVAVRFSVAQNNVVAPVTVNTNANGEAAFEYTGIKAGTDTIIAYADISRNNTQEIGEPFAIATQSYLPATPASITFSQRVYAATTGKGVNVSVVVRDAAGNPVADTLLTFAVTGANPRAAFDVATNAQGVAAPSWVSAAVGTDTVTVTAKSVPAVKATATVTLLAPIPTQVLLAPQQNFAFRGNGVSLIATVFDAAGTRVVGSTVQFRVTGVNTPAATSVVTNEQGEAKFSYTGASVGQDTVIAYVGGETRAATDPFATAAVTFSSRTEDRVLVPNLIGMTQAKASARLSSVGLVVGRVQILADKGGFFASAVASPIVVESQNPQPGAQVIVGGAVALVMRRTDGESPPIFIPPEEF
jgi:hypothetical protein